MHLVNGNRVQSQDWEDDVMRTINVSFLIHKCNRSLRLKHTTAGTITCCAAHPHFTSDDPLPITIVPIWDVFKQKLLNK